MKTEFDKLYNSLDVYADSNIVANDVAYEDTYAGKEAEVHILGLWRLAVDLGEKGKVMQSRIAHLEAVINEKLDEIARLKCDDREIDL